MRKLWTVALLGIAGFIAASSPAQAIILPPDTPPTPIVGTSGPTGVLIDSVQTSFTSQGIPGAGAPYTTGIATAGVLRQADGTLAFLFQLTNTSAADTFTRSTHTNYLINGVAATVVDAGFNLAATGTYTGTGGKITAVEPGVTNYFVDPTTAGFDPDRPRTVSRDPDGNAVRFGFTQNLVDNGVTPGAITNVYFIRTTATDYVVGNFAVIDGFAFNLPSFGPAAVVPEPSTMAMVFAGLPLIGVAAWRRRRGRQS